jgi:hypothetical protein
MKYDVAIQKNETEKQEVVIPDECGDSLWDAVLAQETNLTRPSKMKGH